ncbi:MAG: enoyl-CoA hydratase/isomerase family protein [Promethearchaeati archaeon SRVP18_Atabeyarchaeia-1]
MVEKKDKLARIVLNRADKRNSFNQELTADLKQAFETVRGDADLQGVIVTGAGSVFSAGLDLRAFQEWFSSKSEDPVRMIRLAQETFGVLEDMEKPTLAAINRLAVGIGLELALACDFRIASEDAELALPEVSLGIIPDVGGAQKLPKIVGLGIAKEIAFTGESITAERGEKIGLLNKVVPAGSLIDEADKFMRQILENSPVAVRNTKTLMNKAYQLDPKTMAEYTVSLQQQCLNSNELLRYAAKYITRKFKAPEKTK